MAPTPNIYDKTIRALRETKAIPKHMATLGALRIEAEDLRLISLIEGVLRVLHFSLENGSSKTTPLPLDLVPTPQAWELLGYCQSYKTIKKPEWQVVAEVNGWRPPPSGSV